MEHGQHGDVGFRMMIHKLPSLHVEVALRQTIKKGVSDPEIIAATAEKITQLSSRRLVHVLFSKVAAPGPLALFQLYLIVRKTVHSRGNQLIGHARKLDQASEPRMIVAVNGL